MYDPSLQKIAKRLSNRLKRDALIQKTTDEVRSTLQVDRVILYYFYRHWKGQVTFESLSAIEFSIWGATGADDCFNQEYADMYEKGRVRAIADIESEPIDACHRDFLRSIQVRSNLSVPVLTPKGLWGLLIAHHCQDCYGWSNADIELMQAAAKTLAKADLIRNS